MMYSEFIEISGKSEDYISFSEYSTFIEPIYMDSGFDKRNFIELLEIAFKQIVNPVIERTIRNLSMAEKEEFIMNGSQEVMEYIKKVDFEARKLAYQYLKLYLSVSHSEISCSEKTEKGSR